MVVSSGPGWRSASTPSAHLARGSGVATAVPLLFFAAAARRIPLVSIGLIQFITPVMQLMVAVLLLGEVMSRQRWIGFAIVWVALLVLSLDSLLALRRGRRAAAAAIPTDDYPASWRGRTVWTTSRPYALAPPRKSASPPGPPSHQT